MGLLMIDGVSFNSLEVIADDRGQIRHGLRSDDHGFHGFGEAYFSAVHEGVTKGWVQHRRMHSNLIVAQGCIRFVLFDDRESSPTRKKMQAIESSLDRYGRLSVPPGIWMAFQGLRSELNLLLNIASITHDPDESIRLPLRNDTIPDFPWDQPEGRCPNDLS